MKKITINEQMTDRDTEIPARRPYQPPAILSRERLESAANVCAGFGLKTQPGAPAPGGGLCGQAGLQS